MDFTLKTYSVFLEILKDKKYNFLPFVEYINSEKNSYNNTDIQPIIILRHDVDHIPVNSLNMAKLEYKMGVTGTYYFRTIKSIFKKDIIEEIASLGHEMGYHYEDLALANGNYKKAIKTFEENLNKLREICEIKTICAHGSPLSKYKNTLLWQQYNYKDFGITGNVHSDVDFNEVGYFTDTGRRWNGDKVSVRDKAPSSVLPQRGRKYRTTFDIIDAVEKDEFPRKVMLAVHPHRWSDNPLLWTNELIFQNAKNVIKRFIVLRNKRIEVKK